MLGNFLKDDEEVKKKVKNQGKGSADPNNARNRAELELKCAESVAKMPVIVCFFASVQSAASCFQPKFKCWKRFFSREKKGDEST
jgi:hypothetical protein